MSKIYEALELEQRKKQFQEPQNLEQETHTTEIERKYSSVPVPWKRNTELEDQLIHLYYVIKNLVGRESGKVIQFTSSQPGDGTSTVVEHFGRISMAELGRSVLVLRTEEISGSQSYAKAYKPDAYTLEHLGNGGSADEIFSTNTDPCFFIWSLTQLSFRQTVRSPEQFRNILSKLREHFDLVLLDIPAMPGSPIGFAVCSLADGVVLVLEAEKTKVSSAKRTMRRVEEAGGNVLGVVLNKHRSHVPDPLREMVEPGA